MYSRIGSPRVNLFQQGNPHIMKIGIIGLPQTGKKTIFRLLTGAQHIPDSQDGRKHVEGFADIKDPRFDTLVALYEPRKTVRARVHLDLVPDLSPEAIREGAIFRDIADTDAMLHVVRGFTDESVYHVNGSVNPGRDIESVNAELIMHDLIFVEKRMERIEKEKSRGKDDRLKKESEVMERFKAHLEQELPLRVLDITPEEQKLLSGYPFITTKAMLVALNVSDEAIGDASLTDSLAAQYESQRISFMRISAKLESEISQLDSDDERAEFMQSAGIAEPAVNLLSRMCMRSLGLISFFTVGKDEVRQWLLRAGTLAPEAGGVIHTDIQRGFIRAEVIKYPDMAEHKTEDDVKKAGKFHLMGRDYGIEDGDIICFRFNV